MKSKRATGREIAVQMMYSYEQTSDSYTDIVSNFELNELNTDKNTFDFAKELFKLASDSIENDDEIISRFLSKNWTIERIGMVEKCILRVAISELFHGTAPVYAIMDDFVTLARRYGDEKTASFVNAILESIRAKFEINRGCDDAK